MFRIAGDDSTSAGSGPRVPLRRGVVLATRYSLLPLLLVALSASAYARAHHTEAWARDRFAAAERMREALNGRPPADRARRDYQRIINEYRSVYYGAPTSTKADPSVVAVAEILVEMGRRFDDDRILHEAIAQYKFLRREYPGSKYRCDALFTIGEIYNDDLNDPGQARAAFEDFLHRYPRHRLAEDASQAIADLDRQAAGKREPEAPQTAQEQKPPEKQAAGPDKSPAKSDSDLALSGSAEAAASTPSSEQRSVHLPRVTGIRHWSTPDYTRVAIDLESEIKFGSQRISHPDRIFFDLRDTKLASTLVGKSFDVDEGFLKKIRVAQFKPGRTRVVLEVDDLADYDAFLLPNPYRLIIDIHGKSTEAKNAARKARDEALKESATAGTTKTEDDSTAEAKLDGAPPRDEAETVGLRTADLQRAGRKTIDTGTAEPEPSGQDVKNAAAKSELPPVKKVIVDVDDDDPAPVVARRSSSRSFESKSAKSSSGSTKEDAGAADIDVHEASPTASGDRSLIRALGLKIGKIVIDPGHGGHDTGTIGPNGLEEKDLVLEVGRRLGKLLETRLGAEVVYTRKDDTFIPLETRTAIANQQRADLFISIHANSSRDSDARGVETYYLNFTSSPEALEVAARENAVSEQSIFELQDLVKKIALKEKIEESREFAADVQQSLHSGLAAKNPGIRNRGVKKAPFIVLIGANMPSILAEISFVSNPGDERRLETSEYRQRIAESLYKGIAKYVNGLSGVKVASKIEKVSGQ